MKILVFCKRQYTGKDLIDDRYGRLFEIPEELCSQGHDVKGLAVSYRNRDEGIFTLGKVEWLSINALPIFGFFKTIKTLRKLIKDFKPDILWASSDALIIIIASMVAKRGDVRFVADLYDNYESFGLARFPFIKFLFKLACRKAEKISVGSYELQQLLQDKYRIDNRKILVIGNAVNPHIFFPVDKLIARSHLDLPQNVTLIGTAGALDASRGIKILFDAFDLLRKETPNLYLVLAGRLDHTINEYSRRNIIYLGELAQKDVGLLFNALNLAIICNLDSSFGRYCYPQKYNEIIACGTLVIAANVGEMSRILSTQENALFDPSQPGDLCEKIKANLKAPDPAVHTAATWKERAGELIKFISNN